MTVRFSKGYFQVDFNDGHREAPLRKKIPDFKERKEWKKSVRCGNSKLFSKSPNKGLAAIKLKKLLKQYPDYEDCFYIADMMDIYF